MGLKNARVYTVDEKDVGRVTEVNSEYFTPLKKVIPKDLKQL